MGALPCGAEVAGQIRSQIKDCLLRCAELGFRHLRFYAHRLIGRLIGEFQRNPGEEIPLRRRHRTDVLVVHCILCLS